MPHPVAVFDRFRDLPYPMLLDSAGTGADTGRYSYLMADPFIIVTASGDTTTVLEQGHHTHLHESPFEVLRSLLAQYPAARANQPGLPPFQGGAAGYFGYDLGRWLERLPATTAPDLPLPDMVVGFYDWVLAHDNLTGQGTFFSTGLPVKSPEYAEARVAWAQERLGNMRPAPPANPALNSHTARLTSNFSRQEYLTAVRRVKDYLAAGDVYQVNLSQRLEMPLPDDAWTAYLRLRQANPAAFAAYLDFPEAKVLSASPEQFLHLENRHVRTQPIKGTRPRGATPEEDERLGAELVASEKDRAENLMIVDLLRNDLGRVCEVGSVQVPSIFSLEGHPTVWHLVSTVTGKLLPDKDAIDLLTASFPGGSITGAPKIRAMEIVEELEPVRRGVYCGSIGYLGFDGSMQTSIVIRTLVATGNRLLLQVGGGIVADSEPEAEYEETLHKARGLLRALGVDDRAAASHLR